MTKQTIKQHNAYIKKQIEITKKRFNYQPKELDITKPFTLYHGTSLKYFKKIRKQGIQPRGRRKSNFEGIGISRTNLIYLTTCYACYYASNASINNNDLRIILKIKIDPKKIKLYPDEEFMYHLLGYNHADNHAMAQELYETIDPKNPNDAIKDRLEILPSWQDSLNYMGTVSCDSIPVENIISYAVLDKKSLYGCDPSISPLNFKICGNAYIYELNKLKYKKL